MVGSKTADKLVGQALYNIEDILHGIKVPKYILI
jgi:hypothetical protein